MRENQTREQLAESPLGKIGSTLESIPNLESLFDSVVWAMAEASHSKKCLLMLIDEESGELAVEASIGLGKKKSLQTRVRMRKEISDWLVKDRWPLRLDELKKRRGFSQLIARSGMVKDTLCIPLVRRDNPIGLVSIGGRTIRHEYSNREIELFSAFASQASAAIENARLFEGLQGSYHHTVQVLAMSINARDPYTREHSTMVTQYAIDLARGLNLSEEEVRVIKFAGILHDIGKVGISDSILKKKGKLTNKEWAIIKEHPVIGEEIIKRIPFLRKQRPLIRHHHERMDGKGYPDGLRGKELTLPEHILIVTDAYQAMISNRPYRRRLSKKEAFKELYSNAGSQFHPMVAEALVRLVRS